jgi:hypothetical protein
VINEINGFDHSGANRVGTPAIFGMNFQTISTAQKLPASQGLPGGYLADGVTPGPVLAREIAEHGGANPQDRDVPLVVSGAGVEGGEVQTGRVETTQIAPTILRLLGLDPNALRSVRIEHTRALPVM